MLMPGRDFQAGEYRYGFNGKENDNEVKGVGNQQDYGMRIYDPRIGKFLSIDPLYEDFPWNSVYAFAENGPIENIDLDGLERWPANRSAGGGGLLTGHGRSVGQRARQVLQQAANQIRRSREQIVARNTRNTPPAIKAGAERAKVVFTQYMTNVWNSANFVYGNGAVQIERNRFAGSTFEREVHQALVKMPNYSSVVNQVTFIVQAANGTKVKIRIDNVGVRKEDGKFDLVEAKFSVTEITANNVTRTLTLNQKEAFTMMINGDVVSIKFVGGAQKQALLGLNSGSEVTGMINSIQVAIPAPPQTSTANGTTTSTNNTTTNGAATNNSSTGAKTTTKGQNPPP
jgi:RHS repeat-associated protein